PYQAFTFGFGIESSCLSHRFEGTILLAQSPHSPPHKKIRPKILVTSPRFLRDSQAISNYYSRPRAISLTFKICGLKMLEPTVPSSALSQIAESVVIQCES